MSTMTDAAHGEEGGHEIPHGWRHYVYSTNRKDGTMVFAIMAGVSGGALSIAIRANGCIRTRACFPTSVSIT
jgi:cytochrome c oxidase subunit 1